MQSGTQTTKHIFSVKGDEWGAVPSFTGLKRDVSTPRIMAELLCTVFDGKMEGWRETQVFTENLKIIKFSYNVTE